MKPRLWQRINQLCTNEEVTKKVPTQKLKEMFISAALDSHGISNHSLCATSVSKMYNEGVSEKIIMERSSHLSRAGVRLYERTSSLQQKAVSDTLSPVLPRSDNQRGVFKYIQPTNLSLKKGEDTKDTGKENQVGKLLKHIDIHKMDNCIANFNFKCLISNDYSVCPCAFVVRLCSQYTFDLVHSCWCYAINLWWLCLF